MKKEIDKKKEGDDLKDMAQKVVVGSTGTGKTKGFFERLMNRFGWYRSSEWYLIDSSKFILATEIKDNLKNNPLNQ